MEKFLLKDNHQEIQISSTGAQILSWRVNDQNIFYEGSSYKRSGMPILFPFANPLENNIFVKSKLQIPQHGFARDSEWKMVDKTNTQITFELNQGMISKEMQLAYPYEFNLESIVTISEANCLDYSLKIYNSGNEPLPISPGLHPYFSVNHENKKQINIAEIQDFNAYHFPWDKELSGDFYNFDGKAEIKFSNQQTILLDTRKSEVDVKYLVLWSQNTNYSDYDFVCIEPFSRETNAINTNPILINPLETKTLNLKLVLRK